MTYGDLISRATVEERIEVRRRVEMIIGTKEQAVAYANSLAEKTNRRARWQKEYEKLAKIFLEHGEKALAMVYSQHGRTIEGCTANGKKWILYGNNGWTDRSRYCGTLYVEGEGTIFTSGKLDRVFDYILNM